jgi:transcriptional regulator with XRE-family HTH domain
MIIGDRLRAVREEKKLSQGDIEKRTGLIRCYVSRVENGHTVPALDTIEKFARALEIPIYHLLYDGEKPPALPRHPDISSADDMVWGTSTKEVRLLAQLRRLLSRVNERDRGLLLFLAERMARQEQARSRKRPHGVGGTT